MHKAFLSHSSTDKAYVDVVAHRLSRARVIYDVQNFSPGKDFRQAIHDGLNESILFVLFASTESLKSTWVRFEIDEAELSRLSGKLAGALVFIIDKTVTVRDLPEWMRRGRVLVQTRPTQAARVIMSQLIYETGAEHETLFFGREVLLQEIAKRLVPSSGERVPQIIVASGLDGVGRRSVIRRALRDNLSLDLGPVVALEETDGLDRLYLALLAETMELNTRKELSDAISHFRGADAKERASLVSNEIGRIAADNVATVIVDEGAFIDADGFYRDEIKSVFELLGEDSREPYVALIQRRKPFLDTGAFGKCKIASFSVPPIDLDSTKRFLSQSFKVAGLAQPDSDQLNELGPYLGGYPPAVNLAVGFSKEYGLKALLADKSILVDFKVRAFSRIVTRLKLNAGEQLIAKVLGMEPSLSIDVLTTMTDMSVEEVARDVRRLIDYSLVLHSAEHYSLAAPIRDTVYRAFGLLSQAQFSHMASQLRAKYWTTPGMVPALDAIDATIYAVARTEKGQLSEFADIVLPSTLLRIANQAYNERQWLLARDIAERAFSADPSADKALSILCKSSIRMAHEGTTDWNVAEELVQLAEKKGIRGSQYLRGFMEQKRGNIAEAIKAYYAAEKAGDRSVGVYRDRAHCLFRLGQVEAANKDIRLALERYPRNSFIVDLAAEIAIARGRFGEAESLVQDLEKIDVAENFHHRRATLRAAKKQFELALEDAVIAIRRDPPLHELFAHHVDVLIELRRFDEAESRLDEVSLKYRGRSTRDIQTGLRCKLRLRQGKWREADEIYRQLHLKDLPVHRGLRREILRQKLEDTTVNGTEREQAERELAALEPDSQSLGS
jgi:tetratricopeptide (TPR) repeat protein